jgi:hypothetical protein
MTLELCRSRAFWARRRRAEVIQVYWFRGIFPICYFS